MAIRRQHALKFAFVITHQQISVAEKVRSELFPFFLEKRANGLSLLSSTRDLYPHPKDTSEQVRGSGGARDSGECR